MDLRESKVPSFRVRSSPLLLLRRRAQRVGHQEADGHDVHPVLLPNEEEDSLEKTRQNLNDKIAQLNAAIDNFSTEADRGLSDKITKLNSDMDSLEADITGTGNQTEGAAEKETPTPAESR